MHPLGDRYQIQQSLGKKAGRQTFLATDRETQTQVVVKLLSFNKDFEWDDLKLFEREAETLKSLNHPAIPRYLDFFEVDLPNSKGFALVQSYIAAKSLEEQLKAGRRFSEPEIKQLATSLLEILGYLHSQQPPVIHRDIKPSNILLGNRSGNAVGQVYLVDFGSVQTLAATESSTITVVGTYGYMPPEQFGGRTVPASDLYSLGATLIYLATGKHPAEIPQVNLQLQFQHFTNLSFALLDWLAWMTEPGLENRLDSAQKALEKLHHNEVRLRTNHVQQQEISDPIAAESIYLNACQKSIAVGLLASVLITLVCIQSSGGVPGLIVTFFLFSIFQLPLSLFNGLLIGIITKNWHHPPIKPRLYRLRLGVCKKIMYQSNVGCVMRSNASNLAF